MPLSTKVVTKAVFPVAGLGTRFLPATKASPKEMLNVVDKPLIQYAVEEAIAAGITEMIFVTGRSKRAIEDHFDKAYELEAELEAKNKTALLEIVRSVKPSHVDCVYVRQPEALGLGHAVLCAEKLVRDEPFAIILADEPTGNLDTKTSYEIMNIFSKIHGDGNTVVLVTHEEDISNYAHRITRLRDGLIETDKVKQTVIAG